MYLNYDFELISINQFLKLTSQIYACMGSYIEVHGPAYLVHTIVACLVTFIYPALTFKHKTILQ